MPLPNIPQSGLSLRELLEVKAEVAVLASKVEERFLALDVALKLQAAEYNRRLEHLNGEQARMKDERTAILDQVRREAAITADGTRKEFYSWRDTVSQFINEQRGKSQGLSLGWSVLLAALTVISGIIVAFFAAYR